VPSDENRACLDPRLVAKADRIVRLLRCGGLTIVTAESCTAGLISAALSEGEGAADCLHGSFVAYTKANKSRALGVPADLLRRRGAVNGAVARALAKGALARSPADIAIAVTGVLGPRSDEDGNPVGLVYFCLAARGGTAPVLRRQFRKQPHDRLRFRATATALDMIGRSLARRGSRSRRLPNPGRGSRD
jgi:nicotinamide-nucleotide amidase